MENILPRREARENAFLLAFMHFPTTIAIAVITIFPLYMTYLDAKLQPLYACCWFFFGFGLVAFIKFDAVVSMFLRSCFLRRRIFRFCDEKLGKIVIYLDIVFFRYSIFAFQSGGNLRGGKHSELRSPFFPLALPLSGHVAVLRCGMG